MNQYDLKQRVAIVTGGAQGIGFAVVERMLESGASVLKPPARQRGARRGA